MGNEGMDGLFGSLSISDHDFHRLVQFVRQNYGIDLHQKRQLITSRLATTVKGKGFQGFAEYVDNLLTRADGDEINLLLSKLTTNYTYFMRESKSFDFFQSSILPQITQQHQRDKTLAIWSAGCASGEEPYNVSMYIMDYLGSQASVWDTRLLATDLSTAALNKAQHAVYELPDTVPAHWKTNYFVPASDGRFSVAPVIQKNVIFRQFNLMEPITFRRKFDVIFCRNVMIYFNQATKRELVERFYEATAPGGYLIISLSENLEPNAPYKRIATSIFQKQ